MKCSGNGVRRGDPSPVAPSQASHILVSVQDNGPGLDPQELTHTFDRFWRGDRARSRDTGGSGLGLAITRHLVEAMGGAIGVESQPGQGARFWFILKIV